MKIVVTGTRGFPDVQGGVEKHCEKLYSQLAQKGCNITVFTRAPYTKSFPYKYNGVNMIPVSCPRSKFFEALIHTFKCIMKARNLRPDILHIHGIGPSVLVPIAKSGGMKIVVTHHGPDYMRKKWSRAAKIFLRFCEWTGMTYADRVIAVSKVIANDVKEKFRRGVTYIPNGVEIKNASGTTDFLQRFGLRNGQYILAVGRFVPEKGFHDLLESFGKAKFKGIKLVIAGDADHESDYSAKIKNMALADKNVVLTGLLSEESLSELYNNARLFVLPSYYEGLPIALLEAMSYGLSCIASEIPANRNIGLSDDRFFTPGDTDLLLTKIIELIDEPWTDEERKRQIEFIRNNYNWEMIAEETIQVYRSVYLHRSSSG